MLSSYPVLDLADYRSALAGLILGGLGPDVIAVEPPGGNRIRHMGPYVDDVKTRNGRCGTSPTTAASDRSRWTAWISWWESISNAARGRPVRSGTMWIRTGVGRSLP
jgi:hypothetical protein